MDKYTKYFENNLKSTARLFCLPYAGGNAEFYLAWKRLIPEWMDLCPLQLPGRSFRSSEMLSHNFYDLVFEIKDIIENFNDKNFIIYGHSMGSVLAYEISVILSKPPDLLCLSGGDAPSIWHTKDFYSNLSDKELLEWMINNYCNNADSRNLNDVKEYFNPFLKTLKLDLNLCRNYKTTGSVHKGKTLVIGARDDKLCTTNLETWKEYCPNSEVIYFQNGGHFFNKEYSSELVKIIVDSYQKDKNSRN